MHQDTLLVRQLGLQPWAPVSQAMHDFTNQRGAETPDEIWLVEHPPVFTQGQAGKAEHLLMPGDIPVMQSDRGGQVTYHGPGQQVMYVLINLKRRKTGVRELVSAIEQTVIATLAHYDIEAAARPDAPGATPPYRKRLRQEVATKRNFVFYRRVKRCAGLPNARVASAAKMATRRGCLASR